MFYFLHSFYPQPILWQNSFLKIYWYGLLISVAIVFGILIVLYLTRLYKLKTGQLFDLFFYLVLFGLIGARLGHVLFYDFSYFFKHPLEIFYIWQGGMSIHGAILAGLITILFYARKHQLSFLFLLDLFAPVVALGEAIGRWGNYFNQEIYGLPTNLPWGIPIDLPNRVSGYENFTYFHPTFFYLSFWLFLVFLILMLMHLIRINRIKREEGSPSVAFLSTKALASVGAKEGNIFLTYLVLFTLGRFLIEFLRIDTQPHFCGLRMGQWLSGVVLVLAVFAFRCKNKKIKVNI